MNGSNIMRRTPAIFAALIRIIRLISGVALMALFLPALSLLPDNESVSDLG